MTKNKILKKYFIVFCLAGAIAFAPICPANARSHHHGDTLIAAAIGGAVAGLVGTVVQNTLNPRSTIIVNEYVEPAPVVVHETVIVREPGYHRPFPPVKHTRHYHRHY